MTGGRPTRSQAMRSFLVELHVQGIPEGMLIELSGLTAGRIRRHLIGAGVRSRTPHVDRGHRRAEEAADLIRQGLSPQKAASELGVTVDTVWRYLRREGMRPKAPPPFSEAEKVRARRLLEGGESYWSVARTLGRCAPTVERHVPGFPKLTPVESAERAAVGRRLARVMRGDMRRGK